MLILLLSGTCYGHGSDKSMFVIPFQVSSSYGINATPLQTPAVASQKECAIQCLLETQCVGYNWQQSGLVCELIGQGDGSLENLSIRNGYIILRKA